MARVLVTGGAGYLGAVLVPELLRANHQVIVLDNFLYRQTPFLDLCLDPHFAIERGDVRDESLLRRLLTGVDVIVPLACLTGAPACDQDPVAARTVGSGAIRLLLELRAPGQRIIFPTTNSGYGIGAPDSLCTEDSPLRPVSLYGQLKVEAEQAVLEAGNSLTFRLATLFGLSPRMRLDLLVNDFTYRAVRDRYLVLFEASARRNFLHVRDAAAAFIFAIEHFDRLVGRPYNLGLSDANVTKRQLCERIQKQVPGFFFTEAPIGKDPDQRDYLVSNARIEAAGFRPRISLDEGIAELVRGARILRTDSFRNA